MKRAPIALLILLAAGSTAFGQQKYGYINSNEVVQAMPEFKQLSDAVAKKQKDAQAKEQAMYVSYQAKAKEMQDYGPSMMAAVREEKMKELDSLQRSISTFEQTESGRIQEFQQKSIKPLNDKYIKTVQAVAKENGYTYIFDLASGAVVYYPESSGDVGPLVKKKLGIN